MEGEFISSQILIRHVNYGMLTGEQTMFTYNVGYVKLHIMCNTDGIYYL